MTANIILCHVFMHVLSILNLHAERHLACDWKVKFAFNFVAAEFWQIENDAPRAKFRLVENRIKKSRKNVCVCVWGHPFSTYAQEGGRGYDCCVH